MPQVYRTLPEVELLKSLFFYNKEDGSLLRIAANMGKHRRLFPLKAPKPVGREDSWGYLRVELPGMSNVLLHRVAWKMGTGEDPGQNVVDHINLNKLDNRLVNLRLADPCQSIWNRPKQCAKEGQKPISKYKGVSYVRDHKGELAYCIARITYKGERIYLGTFSSEEAACAAYAKAAQNLHGEFARWEE
jgi:hypothetical protein